jgi:glycosyltransferase involved in cell wall biosynthesis
MYCRGYAPKPRSSGKYFLIFIFAEPPLSGLPIDVAQPIPMVFFSHLKGLKASFAKTTAWNAAKIAPPEAARFRSRSGYPHPDHTPATSCNETQVPIRLAILNQFFPPDFAPTGQLIEELAHQLGKQGVHVEVFTGQPGYAFQCETAPLVEQIDRVRIRRSRTTRLWSKRIRGKTINGLIFCLRGALHLMRSVRRNDLFLVTSAPPFLPVLGWFAHLISRRPYICLIYDLYPDIAIQLGVVSHHHWVTRLWNAANRLVWQRAARLIVLSSSMKARIAQRYPDLEDKLVVIHNWADPDWIVPSAKQDNWFAQEHQLVQKFTVLYSGNMGRCHDLKTVLNAAYELRHEPIQFVFIGDGAKRKECIEQVRNANLDNVRFLPYQDRQNLPYSLTACDLFLVSIDQGMEGLVVPSKLYSALAAGRPIAAVCETHSYLTELLQQARCGAAFTNGDALGLAQFIRQLSNSPDQVEQMGGAGRWYLKAYFTPETIASQYLDVFQKTLWETRSL